MHRARLTAVRSTIIEHDSKKDEENTEKEKMAELLYKKSCCQVPLALDYCCQQQE